MEHGAEPKPIQTSVWHATLAMTTDVDAKVAKRDGVDVPPFSPGARHERMIAIQAAQQGFGRN